MSQINQGTFEMERMLRQNAHEKAFEISVLAQRDFERMRDEQVFVGRQGIMEDIDTKKNQLNQDLNIARSKKINAARLEKMTERNNCLNTLK